MTDQTATTHDAPAELTEEEAQRRAETYLLGNLIKASTRRLREIAVPWDKMTEAEQATFLRRAADDVRMAVRETLYILQAHARIRFRAEVDSVQFKADDIKAVLKLAPGHSAHSLADSAGAYVTIVIEETDELLAVDDALLAGDADQRPLFDREAGK